MYRKVLKDMQEEVGTGKFNVWHSEWQSKLRRMDSQRIKRNQRKQRRKRRGQEDLAVRKAIQKLEELRLKLTSTEDRVRFIQKLESLAKEQEEELSQVSSTSSS